MRGPTARYQCSALRHLPKTWTHSSQQGSPLVRLPLDVLLIITRHLYRHDLHRLSRACISLRILLQHEYQLVYDHPAKRKKSVRRNHLRCFSQDMCDYWLCESCIRLHAIPTSDYPSNSSLPESGCRATRSWSRRSFNTFALHQLDDFHIQTALRLNKMDANDMISPEYREYLERLLRTSVWALKYRAYPFSTPTTRVAICHISVLISDGSFLTLATYRPYPTTVRSETQRTWSRITLDLCQHVHSKKRLGGWLDACYTEHHDLMPGLIKECRLTCKRCATDMLIQITANGPFYWVWQDYGPERVTRSCHPRKLGVPVRRKGESQAFGLIREQYEKAEEILDARRPVENQS